MNSGTARELIVVEYVSIDGVAQAPGYAAEDADHGFASGGWSVPFLADHGAYMAEALSVMGALLLGRRTYEIWVPYWPTVDDPADDVARMLNSVPKYVASTTMTEGAWSATTVVRDVPSEVAELKRQPGKPIVVMGSTTLVHALTEHGLVDEYRLIVHPVVLGNGKRVFAGGGPRRDLVLANAAISGSGLATLTYRTARAA